MIAPAPHRSIQKRVTNVALKHDDNAMDSLACYLRDIEQFGLLTAEQEQKLGARMEQGDPTAQQTLIQSNLRLVIAIARNYLRENISLLDLIQHGNLGLMHATRKWDYTRNIKFSTYATWWIRQYISRALGPLTHTIDLPDWFFVSMKKLKRLQAQFHLEHEREATFDELLELMQQNKPDFTEQHLHDLFRHSDAPVSLDEPRDGLKDYDVSLINLVEDDSALIVEPLEHAADTLDASERIQHLLTRLTPRERLVIELRYGLNDYTGHTLEEVGKEVGITRERIRQIEIVALNKMRLATNARPYTIRELMEMGK